MIQIYLPYLYLIMFACVVIGAIGGYLLCGAFVKGERADGNNYEVLLREEEKKRKRLERELAEEIEHGKLLEEANEQLFHSKAETITETFTEMNKHHNKVLIDPESNKAKIPEVKKFKRRKLGKRSA